MECNKQGLAKEFPDTMQNLGIFQEECAEVIYIISKIRRFGAQDIDPKHPHDGTNEDRLRQEMGDLLAMISILIANGVATPEGLETARLAKLKKMRDFYKPLTKTAGEV